MANNDNPGGKRDGRKAYSAPDADDPIRRLDLLRDHDPIVRRSFLGEFMVRLAPTVADLHPGPWYVRRRPGAQGPFGGIVFVVLDHHNKCVAECDEQSVADAIARSWESIR